MKIPETSANVGAYYGNEENGQWQPNGVVLDVGVGGGVVGSGDAGVQRAYPALVPREHIPGIGDTEFLRNPVYPVQSYQGNVSGYVMAGAYYPASGPGYPAPHVQDDFADYMWMENEEEFDKQVMQQLEEEALMEQCIEAMLEDEQREKRSPRDPNQAATTSNGVSSLSLEETVSRSKLNPLAAEFVPTRMPPALAEKPEPSEATVTEQAKRPPDSVPDVTDSPAADTPPTNTEENLTESTPVVSAADVAPIVEKKKEVTKQKTEVKKPPKQETKVKAKPVAVKSDTKVQPKKKDVKPVKSEGKVEVPEEVAPAPVVVEVVKTAPAPVPVEEPKESNSTGFKPINYAAAAKATKPKPKATSPIDDRPPPTATATVKPDKTRPAPAKDTKSKEKIPQRKNSAK